MLGYCYHCHGDICRYWSDTYTDPCSYCGSTEFVLLHIGSPWRTPRGKNHYIYYDINNPPKECKLCDGGKYEKQN